jgi:hypothetical protein
VGILDGGLGVARRSRIEQPPARVMPVAWHYRWLTRFATLVADVGELPAERDELADVIARIDDSPQSFEDRLAAVQRELQSRGLLAGLERRVAWLWEGRQRYGRAEEELRFCDSIGELRRGDAP